MSQSQSQPQSDPRETLANALGRVPSGLFIVTIQYRDTETGMLASWVQQCSFDPPQVTVALNNSRAILDWFTPDAVFVVNVIPEGNKSLIAHFGKGFELGEPAFAGLEIAREADTPPVLRAAHAYLVCRVADRVVAGDHTLVIGRVTAGAVLHEGKPAVHVRKNGLRY